MGEAFEFFKFLVDNLGITITIGVIMFLFPMLVAFAMWRLAVSSQKALNEEIKEISEDQKELNGLVRGSLSIVKLFISEKVDNKSKDNDRKGDN